MIYNLGIYLFPFMDHEFFKYSDYSHHLWILTI